MTFGPKDRGIRHLSYQQLVERQKKGLCYKCGGPFHPHHQCPDRQLKVMMLEDDEFDDGEVQVMNAEVVEEEVEDEGELSVMSLQGLAAHMANKFHTMRLRGKIHGVPILLLVDSGATHNFISEIGDSHGC